jgi:hypothetical protein
MKIKGNEKSVVVTFDDSNHGEWKQDQQILSVDSVTATLKADGSVEIRSRAGRLALHHQGFVLVFPSWFDPTAEQVIDAKHPVFKSKVMTCYKTTQKQQRTQKQIDSPAKAEPVRHGYIFAFQEKPAEKV